MIRQIDRQKQYVQINRNNPDFLTDLCSVDKLDFVLFPENSKF